MYRALLQTDLFKRLTSGLPGCAAAAARAPVTLLFLPQSVFSTALPPNGSMRAEKLQHEQAAQQ